MYVEFFSKIDSKIAFQLIYSCTTSCIFLVNCIFLINFRSQDILNTQSFGKVVSKNGVLFLGLVGNSGIACVNEHQVLQRESFVSNFFNLSFFPYTFFIIFSWFHIYTSLSLVLNVTFRERTISTVRFGRNASHVIKCLFLVGGHVTYNKVGII